MLLARSVNEMSYPGSKRMSSRECPRRMSSARSAFIVLGYGRTMVNERRRITY